MSTNQLDTDEELLAAVKTFYNHVSIIAVNPENDNLHIRFDNEAGTDFYDCVQRELNSHGYQVIEVLPEEQIIIPANQAGRFLYQYGNKLQQYEDISVFEKKYQILDFLHTKLQNIGEIAFSQDGKCLVMNFNVSDNSFYDDLIKNLQAIYIASWRVEGQNKIEISAKHDLIHLLSKFGLLDQEQFYFLEKIIKQKNSYSEPLTELAKQKVAALNMLFCGICNKTEPDKLLLRIEKEHPQALSGLFSKIKSLFHEYIQLYKHSIAKTSTSRFTP